jgi:hypothetical protein
LWKKKTLGVSIMKANFKPLALATAVAAVTVGQTGVTHAQTYAGNSALGDAAIVPYYTVQGDFVTGVHIINTSGLMQVVKLRYRRAKDSMDALDFNIMLSPFDEWTGSIKAEGELIRVKTDDNSCTAPILTDGTAPMGDIFREGAEEGYIEVIGMGSQDIRTAGNNYMALATLHLEEGPAKGIPLDCVAAESNFFRQSTEFAVNDPNDINLEAPGVNGIYSEKMSVQTCSDNVLLAINPASRGCVIDQGGADLVNMYGDTGNVLKVSYFIRSQESGLEFGGNAVHIADLATGAMMSNQEVLITQELDYFSFLYPDLDGGSPAEDATTGRGRYNAVRTALGADTILNDWSTNPVNAVTTDWVVTMPGQYLMLNLPVYVDAEENNIGTCYNKGQADKINNTQPIPDPLVPICDARDLPVSVGFITLDREEQGFTNPEGGLVISPQTTDTPDTALLPYEVNVIEWTDGTNAPVLDSDFATSVDVSGLGVPYGWARLSVTSNDKVQGKDIAIVDYYDVGQALPFNAQNPFDYDVVSEVPIVGFAAWERSFTANPDANYGRLVDHSYITSD